MSIWMDNIGAASFQRTRTVITNKSPFNAATYRSGLSDDMWQFRFDYDLMTRAQAAPLLGAIAGQRGGTGSFQVFDPDFMVPGAAGLGAGANGDVSGGGQSGTSLFTGGWASGLTLVASPGDKMWIDDPVIGIKMYEIVAPAISIAGGGCNLILDAPLRATPPSGAAVGFRWGPATGRYMTARLTGVEKSSVAGGLFSISVTGEEVNP